MEYYNALFVKIEFVLTDLFYKIILCKHSSLKTCVDPHGFVVFFFQTFYSLLGFLPNFK